MRSRLTSTLITVCLFAPLGCVSASAGTGVGVDSPGSATPDAPVGRAEGESADDLDARKDRMYADYQARLSQASADATACEQLCSLATSICGVQEKLCRIADDHPADDHYQDLCRESKRECQETQQSCIACVESNARRQSVPAQTGE